MISSIICYMVYILLYYMLFIYITCNVNIQFKSWFSLEPGPIFRLHGYYSIKCKKKSSCYTSLYCQYQRGFFGIE